MAAIAVRLAAARRGRRGDLAGALGTAFLGQGSLVVSGVLAARMLGPEQRGYLALAVLLPAVLAQVVQLGLPQAVTYWTARDARSAGALVHAVRPLAIGQAGAAVALQVALLPLFFRGAPREAWVAALITLVVVPSMLAQHYGLALLQGQRRFAAFNTLRTLSASSYSLAAALLFALGAHDLRLVTGAWVATQVAVGACSLRVALLGIPAVSAPSPRLRELIRFGAEGFLGSASPVETFRVDQALIGLFLTPLALGLYVVGLSFTNLPRFVAQSVGMVAYPRIAAETDAVDARRALWRFTWLTMATCAAVGAVLWAAAGMLVPFFFGEEFSESVVLTRLLLIGSLFWAARRVLSDGTRGLGLPRLGSIAEVASWIVLAPALAILMPMWGVEGVAVALVLASAASLAAMLALIVSSGRGHGHQHRVRVQAPPGDEATATPAPAQGRRR